MGAGNLEQLYGPMQRGPRRTLTNQPTNPWAGSTTINSGSVFQTVSTNAVTSGCLIFFNTRVGSVNVSAASGGPVVVNSIVDGVSFAFARQFAVAVAWDDVVMWEIVPTV